MQKLITAEEWKTLNMKPKTVQDVDDLALLRQAQKELANN